jgi:predicted XRE-type DNA-binding protein
MPLNTSSTLQHAREKLARAIAAEVKRQHMTQRQAADRAGVSQSRISRVTTGNVDKTSTARLIEILEALGTVVRISLRRPRDDERPRIVVSNWLAEKAPMVAAEPPAEANDITTLAGLLAGKQRQLELAEGKLQFLQQRIDELGGRAFEELMDAAILLQRARSSGDPDAEQSAREVVEAAVQALLEQRQDMTVDLDPDE